VKLATNQVLHKAERICQGYVSFLLNTEKQSQSTATLLSLLLDNQHTACKRPNDFIASVRIQDQSQHEIESFETAKLSSAETSRSYNAWLIVLCAKCVLNISAWRKAQIEGKTLFYVMANT
jgi:hypothetical protein